MNKYEKNLKVTIGITCFNAEETIQKSIESALNQSWLNKEIIIVDDASIDNSTKFIKDFKNHKNIRIFLNKKNMGAAYSRNLIIKESYGDIICFMDDDDISMSDRVEKQVKEITKIGNPKTDLIACACSIMRKYKTGYNRKFSVMGKNGRLPKGNELANYLLFYETKKGVDYGFGLPTCSLAITKVSFGFVGNFDETLRRVEDMDLSIRLSLNNAKFTSIEEILVIQNATFKNHKSALINYESEIKVIKKYKNYLNKLNIYSHSIEWPKLRYYYFSKKYLKLLITLIFLFIKSPFITLNHLRKTAFQRVLHDLKIKNQFILKKIFFDKILKFIK